MKNLLLACTLLVAVVPVASSQANTPQPLPDGPDMPPPGMHMSADAGHGPQGAMGQGAMGQGAMGHGSMDSGQMGRGSMRIVPPGTWWKNPQIVTALALTTDQQKKIDDLFLKSRVELIHAHATLQEQELLLQPILAASPLDQPKAQAAIDKIADTRATLEKTDARMLLSIRAVLTPDQWTKLQAQRAPGGDQGRDRSGDRNHGDQGRDRKGGPAGAGPGGPGPAPAGPGGPGGHQRPPAPPPAPAAAPSVQ